MAWSPGADYREVDYREVGARRQAADGLMLRAVGSVTRAAGRGEDIAAVADHAAAADIVVALRMAVEEVAVAIISNISQLLWAIDEISSG